MRPVFVGSATSSVVAATESVHAGSPVVEDDARSPVSVELDGELVDGDVDSDPELSIAVLACPVLLSATGGASVQDAAVKQAIKRRRRRFMPPRYAITRGRCPSSVPQTCACP